jgi:hypothetical protein
MIDFLEKLYEELMELSASYSLKKGVDSFKKFPYTFRLLCLIGILIKEVPESKEQKRVDDFIV